jgi:hypothetical protein
MKIQIILSIEFEPQKDYYEDGTSLKEMLSIELSNAKDAPIDFLSTFSPDDIKVTGSIIEGGDS